MYKNKKVIHLVLLSFMVFILQFNSDIMIANAATLNITSYGATANDATDDTTAINNAINAAVSGDTVSIPSGTFTISGSINMKAGVKFIGSSQSGSILKFTGTGTVVNQMVYFENASNVEIKNLTLDGNSNTNVVNGIGSDDGCNSSNVLIHFVTIKNLTNTTGYGPHGILLMGNTGFTQGFTNSEISDCTLSNIGVTSEWGVGIRLAWGSANNKILRNNITQTGRGGICCNNGADDLVIQDNTITESGKWNNDEGEGLGIEVFDCKRAIVEDNVLDHWLSIAAQSSHCAVRRNTISESTGGVAKWGALELAEAENIVFTDNNVNDGNQLGITISSNPSVVGEPAEYTDYSYFGHNTITNATMWGIQIAGGDATNTTKHLYFYEDDFLDTQSGSGRCDYPDDDGQGVRLFSYTSNIDFDSCTIDGNKRNGVQFVGADYISFRNSSITNNTNSAFTAYSGYFEMTGCTVSGNGSNSTPATKSFGNARPTAIITGPSTGSVGQQLSFSSSSTDSDGTIAHVLWDFGAGPAYSSTSQTFTYTEAGTYRVALVVWDNGGRGAVVEKTVTISDGPVPTSTPASTPTSSPTSTPSSANVALNKTATADSTYGSELVSRTVDGSVSTKWASSNTTGGHWIRLDLGQSYSIGRWVVKHAQAGGEASYFNTRDFKLQKSSDGTNWTDVDTVTGNTGSITDRNVTEFTSRYVRLYITTPTTGSDNTARIYEFEVWSGSGTPAPTTTPTAAPTATPSPTPTPTPTPTPSPVNVALNKTATADSTFGSEPVSRTVDGSVSTKWASSNTTGGHWIRLDLGQSYSIKRWVVKHAQAGGEASYFNTRDFKLQKSTDGTNWTDADTVTGNTGSITDRNVTAFSSRYVRLYITTPTTGSDNTARIYELEVWN